MDDLSGPIYQITVDQVTVCRVWRSSEVNAEEGARCAGAMASALERLCTATDGPTQGVMFDVRQGPPAFGPQTQAQLTKMIGHARRGRKPLAFLVGSSAIQRMQFERLVGDVAASHAAVFTDEAQARTFASRPVMEE